jgi:hypothetical protein
MNKFFNSAYFWKISTLIAIIAYFFFITKYQDTTIFNINNYSTLSKEPSYNKDICKLNCQGGKSINIIKCLDSCATNNNVKKPIITPIINQRSTNPLFVWIMIINVVVLASLYKFVGFKKIFKRINEIKNSFNTEYVDDDYCYKKMTDI